MDPISIVGVASASAQIAQFIAQTIQGLCTLRGKFKDADMTIRLLIAELSTIRAAVSQLRDWAEWNSTDSPKETEYMKGLDVALDGCHAAMEVLAEEIEELVAESAGRGDPAGFSLSFMAKAKAVWSEDTMKAHQDRLHAQVQALNLLLQASHCRSSAAQLELLRLKENRRILKKVEDDTRTLRGSMSAANSQAAFTVGSNRQSTIGETEFGFDQGLAESGPYRAMAGAPSPLATAQTDKNTGNLQSVRRKPLERRSTGGDEGYYSMGASRTATPTRQLALNQSTSSTTESRHSLSQDHLGLEARDIFRSRSLSSSKSYVSQPEPAIRRWLSSSSSKSVSSSPSPSSSSSQIDKFSDLRKKKFSFGLGRLNTTSTSSLKARANRAQPISPTSSSRHRGMRGQETNLNQSIDFGSIEGLEAPALVRAAQAGSRIEVERLHDNGSDIEALHGPTRRTALAVAAHCGNSEVVETLIQLNAKLNPRDHTLSTPLHLAASRGHIGVMELLLNEWVPLEETDDKKATALWIAAHRGHLDAVRLLLERGAKINSRAENQLCPLHAAVQRGDSQMVELLLYHGAHVEARDSQFMAALHYACEKGHHAVVDVLLDKGASIEALGVNGRSPLICAAAEGHRHVVELLLRRKASIRSRDERENNALHWAAFYGHVEVADLVIQKKLSINDRTAEGRTPLHLAVIGAQFSAVEFLLRMNATLEPQCRQGYTPLHEACGSDNVDIVRLLLSAGAQAEAPVMGDMRRPIHIAASTGNVEIVQLLCEKGVAIDSRDSAGDRPLCIAAFLGHTEVVEKLLDFKSPLRLAFGDRSYEDSPLCVAAKEGHLGVASALLQRGASVRQKDELGWPPIRYAAHYGHPDVLELLLTQASTLSDDMTGRSALDHIGEHVGFAAGSNLSEERRGRVRELLSQAEDQINAYMAERTMRSSSPGAPDGSGSGSGSHAAELDISLPDATQATASHSQARRPSLPTASSGLSRARTTFAPRPSHPEPPRYQAYPVAAPREAKMDPFVSQLSSTSTITSDTPVISNPPAAYKPPSRANSAYHQPWRPLVSPQMSPMPQMSPEEAAQLIEDRRNEIAQLQLFLPSIDEGTVHDVREYYAPTPAPAPVLVAYEMPS